MYQHAHSGYQGKELEEAKKDEEDRGDHLAGADRRRTQLLRREWKQQVMASQVR